MANNNVNPRSNSQIEKDLEKLECPFTWVMNDITKEDDLEYHSNDDEDLFPLLQLMRHVMTAYVNTKSKVGKDEILKELEKCDDIMVAIRKEINHPEISYDVAYYVLQSTQCFVFRELNMNENFDRVLSEMKKDWRMNSKEKSTLLACRSICWSKYHPIGASEAEQFIREAITLNPNCELWYFILGKNLRRKRRDSTVIAKPNREEISSFEKAYNMSANPVFGVFLAQMYREAMRRKDAKSIYNIIFEQNPTGITILLRLALGFIRLNTYGKAKECLDKVEAVSPKHSMYLHYRGIYHLNKNNYEEAAKYLKEASKDKNIPAEKQYMNGAVMLDKSFDVIQYLQGMLSKYNHLPEEQTQPLLLDLAVAYWLKEDIPNAVKYFTMAVNVNPKATRITNYFSSKALPVKEKNIYQLLKRNILPIVFEGNGTFDQSCDDGAKELQKYCDEHFAANYAKTLTSFPKLNLKN